MNAIESRYRGMTPTSALADINAHKVMPGGDTRAAGWHLPYPLTLERGEGSHVWDVDGNRYIDLIGNYTVLVHGHAYPPIVDAVHVSNGTAWSARCSSQVELAELLCARVASVERVRFTNSGTEAAMLAMEIARLATGREKILMARYGYHGSHPDFLCGLRGMPGPRTYVADFGDLGSFEKVLDDHRDEIAAVIVEPVLGSGGVVTPPPGFLTELEGATRRAGAVFVADEVITFRLAPGGAQSLEAMRPDLTVFAKLIGGGFPIGAVGGRAELLEFLSPQHGKLFHTGTFNGNPVSTAAGVAAVRELTGERIFEMDSLALRLADNLRKAAADAGLPCTVNRSGSLLNLYFSDRSPAARAERVDSETMAAFHLSALCHGLVFSPRGMMATHTVATEALVDEAADRASAAMRDVVQLGIPA